MSGEEEKVNWVSVINFLEKEYTQSSMKEMEWKYEKEVLTQRIVSLQAELRSNTIVCQDLVNRIKILEIALKEEKSKRNGKATLDSQQIALLEQKFNLGKQLETSVHQQFLKDFTKDLKFLQEEPPRLTDQLKDDLPRDMGKQRKMVEKKRFGAHLDVVTALIALESTSDPLFATSSEDCLIKIWSWASVLREEVPEAKHTLRKHTGPLFSLAGGVNPHNKGEHLLFSGGIEGDIKSWRVGRGGFQWTGNWLNGSEQQQTIWQLQMRQDKVLSTSSDGFVRLFKINDSPHSLSLLKEYREKQFNHAAIKFVSDQLFLASCSSVPRMHLYDLEGKICQKYLYESEKEKEALSVQANKIEINKDCKIVIGGCEDGFVRFFDYSTSKIIKKLPTNTAITALQGWEWEVGAGDHTGNLFVWDLRMFKLLQSWQGLHLQKYDTGLTSLCRVNKSLLSGGADGIINIFN